MATKKTLWHSELTQMGPVSVTVKSDVMKSKFAGKQDYVVLLIDGVERTYTTENDDCAEFFVDQKGRTFTIVAEGSKSDASIVYVGEQMPDEPPPEQERRTSKPPPARQQAQNRPPASRPAPSQRPPPASAPPAQAQNAGAPPPARTTPPGNNPPARRETPEEQVKKARQHANRIANVCLVSYSAALYASEQIKLQFGRETSDGELQARAATISIQLIRDGYHHQMPTGILTLRAPTTDEPSDNDGGNV